MRFLRAFGQFWYEFIVGDDWKIAAAVVVALTATAALLLVAPLPSAVVMPLGALLVAACFTAALFIDVSA